MRGNKKERWMLLAALAVAAIGIMGCGKGNTPAPLPPTTGAPGSPYGQVGYTGGLETPNPGQPLRQTGNLLQAMGQMAQTLSGVGRANVNSQSSMAYAIETTYQGTFLRGITPAQPEPATNSQFYSLQGYGDANGFVIGMSGQDEQDSYQFVFEINIGGFIIHSTDQVAMFQSGYGDILKVSYRSTSPTIMRFRITERPQYGFGSAQQNFQQFPYGGYSQVPQIMVYQQVMVAQFFNMYAQNTGGYQQQNYQQPYQQPYQDPYGQQNPYGQQGGYQYPGPF